MPTEFDFDTPIDRRGTSSFKWDRYKDRDVIPMWVADMDFRSPPAVIEALKERADHGIFGYGDAPGELNDTVVSMLRSDYGWAIDSSWIVWLPGLVTGLNVTCRAIGDDGNDVLTNIPAYPPFLSAPRNSRRNLVSAPLVVKDNFWNFDFDRIEKAITPQTKLFILCNPHNPAGRVFTHDELIELCRIRERHNLVICSDEIHCGLILDEDTQHVPTATLSAEISDRTITLMAPSKTFNLPGLGCSFAIISNDDIRKSFCKAMSGIVPHVNVMGYITALAAYRDSHDWHMALLDYLRTNRDIVEKSIQEIDGLTMTHVEATYLAWIDTRQAGIENPVSFFEAAGVGLSDGIHFGDPGFVRLNFGCPKTTLEEALRRIHTAMEHLS
ncbi:MalY/PatB family protein [Chloroflexota bacterium]